MGKRVKNKEKMERTINKFGGNKQEIKIYLTEFETVMLFLFI